MVYGYGLWFMVYGLWFMVYGLWLWFISQICESFHVLYTEGPVIANLECK